MCMNVLPTYMPDVTGDQKKGLDPLGLKLQVIINHHTGTRKRIWGLENKPSLLSLEFPFLITTHLNTLFWKQNQILVYRFLNSLS